MERSLDYKGRWRNHTVAFRVSDEEAKLLNDLVALSGLTKQEYIIRRLTCRDVVVQGNPRVYKTDYFFISLHICTRLLSKVPFVIRYTVNIVTVAFI